MSATRSIAASAERLQAYLQTFERLALQPRDQWRGFFTPRSESMNFGLRFQLAFPCYAVAAITHALPATRERSLRIMAALIDRMLDPRVWHYWSRATGSGDPVGWANIQYSGHLSHMIGLYRLLGGQRFDQPFHFTHNGQTVEHTHTTLASALYEQMRRNRYHGVDCEPGNTYVSCTDHALWSNVLHDRLHGTSFAAINVQWLDFLERRLTFRGPRIVGRGAVSAIYLTKLNVAAPLGLNFMDAWSLALLAPIAPEWTRRNADRLWARLRWSQPDMACLPSAKIWTRMEGCDTAVNTGFAYLLAVELDDQRRAAALLRYAERELQPLEQHGARLLIGGLAAPYTTALFAVGEAGGLGRVLSA
ncbi:MAG TPA: hypothetical protein VFZ66_11390 [Herpetosiphonaceae bacterium]